MIKLIKNKKTKQNSNAYSLRCVYKNSLTKLGSYDQKDNILRLNLDKYLTVLSKGDRPSGKVTQLLEKTYFGKTKRIKIKFTK